MNVQQLIDMLEKMPNKKAEVELITYYDQPGVCTGAVYNNKKVTLTDEDLN